MPMRPGSYPLYTVVPSHPDPERPNLVLFAAIGRMRKVQSYWNQKLKPENPLHLAIVIGGLRNQFRMQLVYDYETKLEARKALENLRRIHPLLITKDFSED